MLDNLKPYPKYKDSSVPWLGNVPEHWEVKRLKQICSKYSLYGANIAVSSYSDTGVRFLRTTDITEDGYLKKGGVHLSQDKVIEYLLSDGDLLISRSGTVGRSFLYEYKNHGLCAYAGYLVRFVPSKVLPRYLFLFTKTQAFADFLKVMAISSTIENVNGEKYANAFVTIPSLDEQEVIARFLDHATNKIDRLIAIKRKTINLLNEQKSAIIQQAVTKGIDPDVPLKDSGIPWLGEIPEHWEVIKIKNLAKVGNGSTPSRSRIDYWSNGHFPWLNSSVVNKSPVENANQFVTSTALKECHLPKLYPNTILIAITGQGKTRGKAAILNMHATINQHLAYIQIRNPMIRADFMESVFTAAYGHLRSISDDSGSTKGALTCSDLKHFKIPLPKLEEQIKLLAWIQDQVSGIDSAIAQAEKEITLLREYRTGLIADVVTGKLDVREVAKELPEEIEVLVLEDLSDIEEEVTDE